MAGGRGWGVGVHRARSPIWELLRARQDTVWGSAWDRGAGGMKHQRKPWEHGVRSIISQTKVFVKNAQESNDFFLLKTSDSWIWYSWCPDPGCLAAVRARALFEGSAVCVGQRPRPARGCTGRWGGCGEEKWKHPPCKGREGSRFKLQRLSVLRP